MSLAPATVMLFVSEAIRLRVLPLVVVYTFSIGSAGSKLPGSFLRVRHAHMENGAERFVTPGKSRRPPAFFYPQYYSVCLPRFGTQTELLFSSQLRLCALVQLCLRRLFDNQSRVISTRRVNNNSCDHPTLHLSDGLGIASIHLL